MQPHLAEVWVAFQRNRLRPNIFKFCRRQIHKSHNQDCFFGRLTYCRVYTCYRSVGQAAAKLPTNILLVEVPSQSHRACKTPKFCEAGTAWKTLGTGLSKVTYKTGAFCRGENDRTTRSRQLSKTAPLGWRSAGVSRDYMTGFDGRRGGGGGPGDPRAAGAGHDGGRAPRMRLFSKQDSK